MTLHTTELPNHGVGDDGGGEEEEHGGFGVASSIAAAAGIVGMCGMCAFAHTKSRKPDCRFPTSLCSELPGNRRNDGTQSSAKAEEQL